MPAPPPQRVPVSTYRLQFSRDFTFSDAQKLVPYLSRLGITECYCSPLLAACPGSAHGYDICDNTRLNPEYGDREDFSAFARTLDSHQMGLILDFVPNHMGADPSANRWWRDVLESGPSSRFAGYFDIDWDPVKTELKGKVLLPILADQYGVVLENGQLQIQFDDGCFSLQYFDRNLPIDLRQMRKMLRYNLRALESECQTEDPDLREFLSILFALDQMPAFTKMDPDLSLELRRERQVVRGRLAKLVQESPCIRRHIEENVRQFNGQPGDPKSYDLLHDLLDSQTYRLSYWRTAHHEINYRRFFDINELVAIRMEDMEVFRASHSFALELIRQGIVTGLRLDHVDGLLDPAEYFQRLAASIGHDRSIYLVGEKILSPGERLRQDWVIQGTTGYDFLNDLNGLFVESQNAQTFRRIYARFVGRKELFADVAYESKKLIIMSSMVSELNMLARELNRISEVNRRFRDFTLASLQEALREVVACFPIYRTYCNANGWDEYDQKTVDTAVARALRRNPAMEASIFQFLRQLLLQLSGAFLPDGKSRRECHFVMKFQQYTGPVQAKGLEDTAFYRYGALLSLNEVGGDPARFGRSPDEFHRANLERRQLWPLSMLATATHDTKRGEDARARINVLSEIPSEWRTMIFRWARANAGMRTVVNGSPAPDRSDEYIFYQALVSAWPAGATEPDSQFVDRISQFMLKAVKEKKVHTSWINPSVAYDTAVAEFVRRTLTGSRAQRFLQLFVPFARRIAWLGMLNSLSQVVFKIASPGVPDFYQGTELWDLTLVDPDNRRRVDYQRRQELLDKIEPLLAGSGCPDDHEASVAEMLSNWQDARIKLYVNASGLRLRRSFPRLFLEGDYVPLPVEGEKKDHLVSFARIRGDQSVVVLAPRLVGRLVGPLTSPPLGHDVWEQTKIVLPKELSDHRFWNVLTRKNLKPIGHSDRNKVSVAETLHDIPVAILLGQRGMTKCETEIGQNV